MLVFVGLGLWDEKDITLRGLEYVKKADVVYVEFYTSKLSVGLKELERAFGKEIKMLERKDLEEESYKIVEEAKMKDVVILCAGDPMIATTHSALMLEAERAGVKTRVIHNASIVNAVCGLTGLHNYRFGKSATVSWHRSRTPVDILKQNLSIDAHTLLFLDLHPRPMKIRDALEILFEIDESLKDLYAVGIARAGSDEPIVKCDKAKELLYYDFGEPLHVLVFLAKTLHFMEYECLREFAKAPEEIKALVC